MAAMALTTREARDMEISEGAIGGILGVIGGAVSALIGVGVPAYVKFSNQQIAKRKANLEMDGDRLENVTAYFERILASRKAERDAEKVETDAEIGKLKTQVEGLVKENGECHTRFAVLEERMRNFAIRLGDQTPVPNSKLGG